MSKMRKKTREPYQRSGFEQAVAKQAVCRGLFLLVHEHAWDFLSKTTGQSVLTWYEDTRRAVHRTTRLTVRCRSAFDALRLACEGSSR